MIINVLQERIYFLPILTTVYFLCSLLVSYIIAVANGAVEPFLPYISRTAVGVPQRGVFAQLINIGSLFFCANAYVRYMNLEKLLECDKISVHWRRSNVAALILGLLSAFGLSMVANFQTDDMREPHYFGAAIAFGCGTAYCCTQAALNFKLWRVLKSKRSRFVVGVQLLLSLSAIILVIVFGVSKALYLKRRKYYSRSEIMNIYLTSTLSEWLLAITTVIFNLTFVMDFKSIKKFTGPRIEMVKDQCSNGHALNHSSSLLTPDAVATEGLTDVTLAV